VTENTVALTKEFYSVIGHARVKALDGYQYDIANAVLGVEVRADDNKIQVDTAVKGVMITYSVLCLIFLCVVCVHLYLFRATSVSKIAQGEVLGCITVACIVAVIGGVTTLDEATDAKCLARPWVIVMPLCFAFSLIMARTMRAAKILNATKTLKRIKVTTMDLAKQCACLLFPLFLIFLLQGVSDPPEAKREYSETNDSDFQVVCQTENDLSWNLIVLFIFAIYVAIACRFAHVSSKMITLLNEGAHLAFGIYSMSLFALIAVVCAVITSTEPSLIYFTSLFCINTGVIVMIGALVLPKREFLTQGKDEVMSMMSADEDFSSDDDEGAITVETTKMDDGNFIPNSTIDQIIQLQETLESFTQNYRTMGKVKREDFNLVVNEYQDAQEAIYVQPSETRAVRVRSSAPSQRAPTSSKEPVSSEFNNDDDGDTKEGEGDIEMKG